MVETDPLPLASSTSDSIRGSFASTIVRLAVAALLLVAAGMKVVQISTEPANNCGELSCRWQGIVETEAEILLGLWLLSGLAADYSRAMATIAFGAFAVITCYKGIKGDASCGCFGKMEIRPWYTMALDLVVVAGLLVFRPIAGRPPAPPAGGDSESKPVARPGKLPWWTVAFAVVALLAVAATAWPMLVYRPARQALDGKIVGGGPVLIDATDLNNWLHRPLPLLMGNWLECDANLRQGEWKLILYRSSCKACRRELAERDKQARDVQRAGRPVTVAVAELPPGAPPGENAVAADSPLVRAKLKFPPAWFVHTPVLIRIQNGMVVNAEFPQAQE